VGIGGGRSEDAKNIGNEVIGILEDALFFVTKVIFGHFWVFLYFLQNTNWISAIIYSR
jgi:hypothetical protein